MKNDSISRALIALSSEVDNSNLSLDDKNALKHLIEKLSTFYKIHYDAIMECNVNIINKKIPILVSLMTDYIVAINDTIRGKNSAINIVSMIHKELNYDDGKGQFKRKKLLFKKN